MIEAQQVLGTFDAPLREYAANKLSKQGLRIVKVRLLGYMCRKLRARAASVFAWQVSAALFYIHTQA